MWLAYREFYWPPDGRSVGKTYMSFPFLLPVLFVHIVNYHKLSHMCYLAFYKAQRGLHFENLLLSISFFFALKAPKIVITV
jgi:hypothetical protein